MAQLCKHLCRDSSLWLKAQMRNGSPGKGGEQAGEEGEQIWVSVGDVLDAFNRRSCFLYLMVCLVTAWLASGF